MEQLALNFETRRLFQDLTVEEQAIISHLWPGRVNAVNSATISKKTGINERRIRKVVRHLIEEHGLCIGSAPDNPPGFYIATDPGEIADIVGALRHRGISILIRAARISGNSLEEIFKQGRLELENAQ